MGLKFKDKVSAGVPVAGDVAEREIQFDLKNKSIYSSTNGTDLISISTPEIVGKVWDTNTLYAKGDLVTKPHTFASGFQVDDYFIAQKPTVGDDPDTDHTSWRNTNIVKYINVNANVTIGAGKDFAQLDEAILYTSRFVAVDGAIITFVLEADHVIDYDMRAIDMQSESSVVITSANNKVTIDVSGCLNSFMFFATSLRLYFQAIDFTITGIIPATSTGFTAIFGLYESSFSNCNFVFTNTFDTSASTVGMYLFRGVGSLNTCNITTTGNENFYAVVSDVKTIRTVYGTGTINASAYAYFYLSNRKTNDCYLLGCGGVTSSNATQFGLVSTQGTTTVIHSGNFAYGLDYSKLRVAVTAVGTIKVIGGGCHGGYNQAINVQTANGIIIA